MKGFTCSICGKYHVEIPMCFGADYPDYYFNVPAEERAKRIEVTQDLCVVDEQYFFIRGRIEIPVINSEELFCWNVWVSLSESDFIRANTMWNNSDRIFEKPYFGWLQTIVPGYPSTLNIRTLVHTQKVGIIPRIEVIEEDHPLTVDQKKGITIEQVISIVEKLLH